MEHEGTRCDVAQPTGAPLPAARAFVVQLRAETDPAGELFVGRAEHMASGTAERFTSAAESIGRYDQKLWIADVRRAAYPSL